MKSNSLKTAWIIGTALLAIAITGCKKEKVPVNVSESFGTAVIRGKVWADLNTTASGNEPVTTATIIAKISTADLYSTTPANPVNRIYTTSVKSDGTYSITVDAGLKPVSVSIYPQDFEADRIVPATPPATGTTNQRHIFTSSSFVESVVQGGVRIVDITYN